jgi:hypothetical protein
VTFEVKMATVKLKTAKSPRNDTIPTELIKARSRTIGSWIHRYINSTWNKRKYLKSGRIQSLYLFMSMVLKQIVVIVKAYNFC